MTELVEAEMASGALIYVGHAAPQRELCEQFGGGAVQFWVQSPGHRLHLKRSHSG